MRSGEVGDADINSRPSGMIERARLRNQANAYRTERLFRRKATGRGQGKKLVQIIQICAGCQPELSNLLMRHIGGSRTLESNVLRPR